MPEVCEKPPGSGRDSAGWFFTDVQTYSAIQKYGNV
jgi:hypothetical protein